jgi:hypothetical protein
MYVRNLFIYKMLRMNIFPVLGAIRRAHAPR